MTQLVLNKATMQIEDIKDIVPVFNILHKVERTQEEIRHAIMKFQNILCTMPGAFFSDSLVCPLTHTFANGIYVREIFIPRDIIVVGKIHRYKHPNFLMQGEVLVFTEYEGVQHLKAPVFMISQEGTKRVLITLEDTVWITVHTTHSTNIAEIEKDIFVEDYTALVDSRRLS